MTPLAEAGAPLADSVADVAKADIISVTVLNDEQVREVVAGEIVAVCEAGHRHRDPFDDQRYHRRRTGSTASARGHPHRRRADQRR